jgi:hypothetical protein
MQLISTVWSFHAGSSSRVIWGVMVHRKSPQFESVQIMDHFKIWKNLEHWWPLHTEFINIWHCIYFQVHLKEARTILLLNWPRTCWGVAELTVASNRFLRWQLYALCTCNEAQCWCMCRFPHKHISCLPRITESHVSMGGWILPWSISRSSNFLWYIGPSNHRPGLRCGFGWGDNGLQRTDVEPALRAVQLLVHQGTILVLLCAVGNDDESSSVSVDFFSSSFPRVAAVVCGRRRSPSWNFFYFLILFNLIY